MYDLNGDGKIDPVEFGVAESSGWLDDDENGGGGGGKPPKKNGGSGCGCLTFIMAFVLVFIVVKIISG